MVEDELKSLRHVSYFPFLFFHLLRDREEGVTRKKSLQNLSQVRKKKNIDCWTSFR